VSNTISVATFHAYRPTHDRLTNTRRPCRSFNMNSASSQL